MTTSSDLILQESLGEIFTESGDTLIQDIPYIVAPYVSPITSRQTTIPSYLYWQYQTDQDLQAFVTTYNQETQSIIDWFNQLNLPIYTGLSGALLDWVGAGIYGYPRPVIGVESLGGIRGSISTYPIGDIAINSASADITDIVYNTPDDMYKRMLTWFFFKGDGENFSIPWLKRRLARFLYGLNGTNIVVSFTPTISVTFTESSSVSPTCNIAITNAPQPAGQYLELFINTGLAGLPFRFTYNATIT